MSISSTKVDDDDTITVDGEIEVAYVSKRHKPREWFKAGGGATISTVEKRKDDINFCTRVSHIHSGNETIRRRPALRTPTPHHTHTLPPLQRTHQCSKCGERKKSKAACCRSIHRRRSACAVSQRVKKVEPTTKGKRGSVTSATTHRKLTQ